MVAQNISPKWRKLLDLLPGYDPFEDDEGYHFDEDAADKVIGFAETMTHIKGDLQKQLLMLEDWQKGFLGNLFGWKSIATGLRRYGEALLFVPRKNGKSILASIVCLYMFFCDGEKGAEIVCAAFERDQAKFVWDVGRRMIMADPNLMDACKIFQNSIVIDEIASSFKPMSSEAKSSHGGNIHFGVLDELHLQRNDELVTGIETGMASRAQPLFLYLTTSDYERESICNETYDYAKMIMDGTVKDPNFLPGIWEATIKDDWTDEEVWKKANPNYGISVRPEYIAKKCKKAQNKPSFENEFKRLHLNIRTEQNIRYMVMSDWDKCNGVVDEKSLLGRIAYGGLDLSVNEDLSALVFVFPDDDGGFDVIPKFYSPRDLALARKKKGVDYLTWERLGYLTLTPGNEVDYDFIMADMEKAAEDWNLIDIGYDPWNAKYFGQIIEKKRIVQMVEFPQNYSCMNEPMKTIEAKTKAAKIRHGGHPILRWNATNLMAKRDPAGRVRPIKGRQDQKIDGIVAFITAMGRALFSEGSQESTYEDGQGLLSV